MNSLSSMYVASRRGSRSHKLAKRVSTRRLAILPAAVAVTALIGSGAALGQGRGFSAGGGLDIGALLALPSNLEALGRANAAANAEVPKGFNALETDYYQRQLAKGMSPPQAPAWVRSAEGRRYIAANRYQQAHQDCVKFELLPNATVHATVEGMQKGTVPIQTYKCKE